MTDKKNQAGIALGVLFGLMHTLWIIAVGAGFGKSLVNTFESSHFLSSTYSVTSFDPATAGLGIIGAAATGYIIGWIFMYLYTFTGRKLD
jgi:hypothetical protein